MEKYSFIKFLKKKKKELIKNIKYLKNQKGGGPPPQSFNDDIMIDLLLLSDNLSSINAVTTSGPVNSYEGLSQAISEIEKKIDEYSIKQKTDSELLDPYQTINIIERINSIDKALDQNAYLLKAKSDFFMVPEKISTGPNSEPDLLNKFLKDTLSFAFGTKKSANEANDADIQNIISQIKQKNSELEKKIKEIDTKEIEITTLISDMEKLYKFELEKNVKPTLPNPNGYKSKKIPTANDNTTPFEYLEDSVDMMDPNIFNLGLSQIGGSNKYPKKFLKINIDKNIINLYNEWVETLKNYKNKLKGELNNKLESKKLIGGKVNTKIKFKNKLDTNVLIGGADVDPHFNEAFNLFERKIILIRQKIKELTLVIKRYNVMYVQLINFQNFITKFISLKVLEGGYIVYTGLDYALVSYFDTMLSELNQIMDTFNETFISGKVHNSKEHNILDNEVNKRLYKYFYFIIKILGNFFNKLKKKWYAEIQADNSEWHPDKWIYTEYNEDTPIASHVFFLLTIFNPYLSAWKKAQHKKVANFLKINTIPGRREIETFKSSDGDGGDKYLNEEILKNCITDNRLHDNELEQIANIKFEQIFPKTYDNQDIPNSMQLPRVISEGESVVVITYGYSGVGKTFSLFGKNDLNPAERKKGMLQTILSLHAGSKVSVKIFELYGLAVPYKFYWDSPKNMNHYILNYKVIELQTKVTEPPTRIDKDRNDGTFNEFLTFEDGYDKLEKNQVDGFESIVQQIDEIRRCEGRIKTTKNNPESSRSIMIYDFKIEQLETKSVHFVIIDLPGKENIYETFCKDEAPQTKLKEHLLKFQSPKSTNLKVKEEVLHNITVKKAEGNRKFFEKLLEDKGIVPIISANNKYSGRLIRTILFSNILWISMIPEVATEFDSTEEFGNRINTLWSKELPSGTLKKGEIVIYNNLVVPDGGIKYFTTATSWKSYTGGQLLPETESTSFDKNYISAILRLRAFHERILYTIVNFIENGQLEILGEVINKMIDESEANTYTKSDGERIPIKYGYVGLEAFYINENILGLLQVLANKVEKDRGIPVDKYKQVVDNQKEIYKDIIKRSSTKSDVGENYPLKLPNNPYLKPEHNFVADNEFYSNIQILNVFERDSFLEKLYGNVKVREKDINGTESVVKKKCYLFVEPTPDAQQNADLFKNNFRLITDEHFDMTEEQAKADPNIPKHFKKPYTTLINNYNYNAGFNLKDPPIKKILEPYLEIMENIYVLFVVSNSVNNKNDDTCDKQHKLLFDTKKFMDVIANV